MKSAAMWALLAAQVATFAQPAAAAELQRDQGSTPTQTGSFVGGRIRVPLGASRERAHAGLAFTATQRSGGTGEMRFSRGVELGFAGDDKVRLSLGGTPVSRLVERGSGPEGRKLGVSTIGWIAIGVGVTLVALYAAAQLCADGEICGDDGDG